MTAIDAAGVSKTYGEVLALRDLSLSVEPGEIYGLLGPNGAGKTTTIEVLTGQLVPDAGEVSVLGTDPTTSPVATRERVGVLPERESPPSFMTPREYFAFVGAVRGVEESVRRERVEAWAERLSFREQLDTWNTDLSRGQQQKVLIAAAFLHEPRVVFIDEPLANLDPIVQERVKRYLRGYAEAGNAVLLSTHHVAVAAELCHRVGVVTGGELREERRPADLGEDESLLDAFLDVVGDDSLTDHDHPADGEFPIDGDGDGDHLEDGDGDGDGEGVASGRHTGSDP